MNWVAISFGFYTLAVMAFGIYSARLSKSTSSDFFLADRGLGAWVAGLSGAASAESGWVTLGLVGEAYKAGIGALWIVPGTVMAFLFIWLVMANPLRRFSMATDSITLPDVLSAKFDLRVATWIRLVSVIIILAMLTSYVAAQLSAAGKAFVATFDWNYRTGVATGAAIVLIYTMIGGFRAVAWTDVVQAALMIAAVTLLPVVMIADVGGPVVMWERMRVIEPLTDPWGGRTGLALLGFLSVWIGVPLGYPGQPHVLMRLMAAQDETAVRRAAIISSCGSACYFWERFRWDCGSSDLSRDRRSRTQFAARGAILSAGSAGRHGGRRDGRRHLFDGRLAIAGVRFGAGPRCLCKTLPAPA